MKLRTSLRLAVVASIALSGALAAVPAQASSHAGEHGRRVCATAAADSASCFAEVLVDAQDNPVDPFRAGAGAGAAATVSGKTPADIQSAYGLAGLSGQGRTLAIVDAYGYPNAERDLAAYRSYFHLPACSVATGCLTIVNQSGGSNLPAFNLGWADEQALDLDAVSAACPDCRILLVQASSSSMADLGTAVNTAARLGATAISNSYGSSGDLADTTYGGYYSHPGIAVTASTGDNGFTGPSYPASSRYVTAVGGTSLSTAANTRGWSEAGWSGAGSGCSTLNVAPTGQNPGATGCAQRAMADVSAVADPNTGLAVYAPTSRKNSSWAQYGGTSLSSPLIASVFALAGAPSGYSNDVLYAAASSAFNDVTSGSNGSCTVTVLCTAGAGWDGPTGLGTPRGTAGF
ncbi:S53 family peptidase [Microbacterium xylanilyticum]